MGLLLLCALRVQFGESALNLVDSCNDRSRGERRTRKGGVPARAWGEDGCYVPDDCLLSRGGGGLPAERIGLRRQKELLVPVLRGPRVRNERENFRRRRSEISP